MFSIKPISYEAARSLIRNGDMGLARGCTLEGSLITEVTGSPYTHATMFGWAKPNTLMIGETRQHRDGRLIDARSEIIRWPGYYDVFRVRDKRYNGNDAWTFVCHAAGSCYSWSHILRVWARRRLGTWIQPAPNSNEPASSRFCSELAHAALRAGHGPELKDHDSDVAPGDLADLKHFRYLFTVFATEEQVQAFQAMNHDRS
jgi:hypothetical protein